MTIYLAHWFDCEDKMFRVAGIYRTKRAAWKRVIQLDGGTVQALTLGRAVRFTHEPSNFRCSLALNEKRDFMAPESERAKNCTGCEHPQHVGGECHTFVDLPLGTPYCDCQIHNHPTLTCSEVVERLRKEAMVDVGGSRPQLELDPTKAAAILHSWRERRVQELEEALRMLIRESEYNRTKSILSAERIHEQLEWWRKFAADSLAKSDEWREQIRKGAKHE